MCKKSQKNTERYIFSILAQVPLVWTEWESLRLVTLNKIQIQVYVDNVQQSLSERNIQKS
jgi:hypothetical protein